MRICFSRSSYSSTKSNLSCDVNALGLEVKAFVMLSMIGMSGVQMVDVIPNKPSIGSCIVFFHTLLGFTGLFSVPFTASNDVIDRGLSLRTRFVFDDASLCRPRWSRGIYFLISQYWPASSSYVNRMYLFLLRFVCNAAD